MSQQKVKLSNLRKIGWTYWDPIGIRNDDGSVPEGAQDEYDNYLLRVAGILQTGGGVATAKSYLALIESDHMGLGIANLNAIEATVIAIQNYLIELGYKDL